MTPSDGIIQYDRETRDHPISQISQTSTVLALLLRTRLAGELSQVSPHIRLRLRAKATAMMSLALLSPIINFNLKDGFYLRSSAMWNFDPENRNHSIPVGLRIGKVFQVDDKVTMIAFVEPPRCSIPW
jgi:hypothetical protein